MTRHRRVLCNTRDLVVERLDLFDQFEDAARVGHDHRADPFDLARKSRIGLPRQDGLDTPGTDCSNLE